MTVLNDPRGAGGAPEALIREARRRKRRRQLAMFIAIVLALAGGVGARVALDTGGHPRSQTGAGPPPRGPASNARFGGINTTVLMFGVTTGAFAYLDNLDTGHFVQRLIPGIIGCDCQPYLLAVGSRLVYVGEHGTTVMASNLTGKPRVLGTTSFFAPAATSGRVWLEDVRARTTIVRSVPVTGGPPGPSFTLPGGTLLDGGTSDGLLLSLQNGALETWTPGGAPKRLPYFTARSEPFAFDARHIAYGTDCKWDTRIRSEVCQQLRVLDTVTHRLATFGAPQGTAGWLQGGSNGWYVAISPRNTMMTAAAVTSPAQGRARLFVLSLTSSHPASSPVPSSTESAGAMALWSADGSWLIYQGPRGHLWAYQPTTGKVRSFTTPCCQYTVMAAAPNDPG